MDPQKLIDDAIVLGKSLDFWEIEMEKVIQEMDRPDADLAALEKRLKALSKRGEMEVEELDTWFKNYVELLHAAKKK